MSQRASCVHITCPPLLLTLNILGLFLMTERTLKALGKSGGFGENCSVCASLFYLHGFSN